VALYAQLLSEQDLTEEQQNIAEQILVSADKLTFLIQSLVKASRLESGIVKIDPKPGNVDELVAAAIAECESLAAKKNIRLTFDESDKPVMALYDPRWCGEALFNIIENAIKYTSDTSDTGGTDTSDTGGLATSEGGSVNIAVTAYEMFVRIDVTDTGRGIREEDLPMVFGRFWRAAESADNPGVGIGLYLARAVITACGGYIKVSADYGTGSTVSTFLPKA
jgi:signal transduction histidine kinase